VCGSGSPDPLVCPSPRAAAGFRKARCWPASAPVRGGSNLSSAFPLASSCLVAPSAFSSRPGASWAPSFWPRKRRWPLRAGYTTCSPEGLFAFPEGADCVSLRLAPSHRHGRRRRSPILLLPQTARPQDAVVLQMVTIRLQGARQPPAAAHNNMWAHPAAEGRDRRSHADYGSGIGTGRALRSPRLLLLLLLAMVGGGRVMAEITRTTFDMGKLDGRNAYGVAVGDESFGFLEGGSMEMYLSCVREGNRPTHPPPLGSSLPFLLPSGIAVWLSALVATRQALGLRMAVMRGVAALPLWAPFLSSPLSSSWGGRLYPGVYASTPLALGTASFAISPRRLLLYFSRRWPALWISSYSRASSTKRYLYACTSTHVLEGGVNTIPYHAHYSLGLHFEHLLLLSAPFSLGYCRMLLLLHCNIGWAALSSRKAAMVSASLRWRVWRSIMSPRTPWAAARPTTSTCTTSPCRWGRPHSPAITCLCCASARSPPIPGFVTCA